MQHKAIEGKHGDGLARLGEALGCARPTQLNSVRFVWAARWGQSKQPHIRVAGFVTAAAGQAVLPRLSASTSTAAEAPPIAVPRAPPGPTQFQDDKKVLACVRTDSGFGAALALPAAVQPGQAEQKQKKTQKLSRARFALCFLDFSFFTARVLCNPSPERGLPAPSTARRMRPHTSVPPATRIGRQGGHWSAKYMIVTLQKAQNRAARVVTKLDLYTPTSNLLN